MAISLNFIVQIKGYIPEEGVARTYHVKFPDRCCMKNLLFKLKKKQVTLMSSLHIFQTWVKKTYTVENMQII